MFHSKQDVDRHVNEVFRNIKSEYQRNLKCLQIGKLYYKFKDYKSAIKYLNRYILTSSNSAAAHRLLGECYLGINAKTKALEAFKTSLELNSSQNDLVLKVCTLLMDPEVSAVTTRANYWLERAESLFPTNPIVFRLREHILKSNMEGKQENGQLEKLILSEITARPADVTVRIRLLNFFLDTKRYKIAYQHALEIEERNTFSNDPRWYDCLCNLVQVYEKANTDLSFSFFIRKIIFLERRVDLFMQEFQDGIKTLPECSSALFAFDQNLYSVSKIQVPPEEAYFFPEFMKHMKAQLSFHMATLALKRAKKEYGIWPKAFQIASPLLLQSTETTMDLEGGWHDMWTGKNKMEREVKILSKCASFRISQAGHVLLSWSESKGSKFLEKVSQFCGGKWQNQVYQGVFYSKEHQMATATSLFINDSFFGNVPMRLLTETELSQFDEDSQTAYPDSLHHLVWLGLAYCNANGQFTRDFRCLTVPNLQFTVENLSQFGSETLNQLDVDAFLYASVLCAKSAMPNNVPDRPSRLPVSISEELCSPAQAEWWVAVYKTYKNQIMDDISETRLKLRKGIETIRAYGQHGLHVKIIVTLAKLFQERAGKSKIPNEMRALEERAYLYWTAAIPLLEKIEKNQHLREVANRLFDYRGKDLTVNEVKTNLEDGRLFLACRLMKQGKTEQAIEAFQSLKSPYATFYQGLIYEKLASEEVNHRPESITSENRSQHIVLLTRARDAFYLTWDRLRCPMVDPNHPLCAQLQDHLEKIENQLARIDPDSTINRNGDSESDETDTAPGPLSPEENLDASFNTFNSSNLLNPKNQNSRGLRLHFSEKRPNIRYEARPSPERLDAQLRHLVQVFCNGQQSVIEQLKEIRIELKDLGCVMRDVLAESKKRNEKVESSKRSVETLKPEDLFDIRDEDFEPYNPFPSYQMNRQMPGAQGTATSAYGTHVPSPIPPVPPVIPTAETPLIPPAFYPGVHTVPSIDPSLLLYQTMGCYPQGMPGFGDNQTVPDYKGSGIQKGVPFAKNAHKAPDSAASVATPVTKSQPPNVVITSSDTLPAFTISGTPVMSVTIPPQHIRNMTPTTITQKPVPGQVHPYQIQMPLQAQLVKDCPTEKLNSLISTSTTSGSISSTFASAPKPAQQPTVTKEASPVQPPSSSVKTTVEKTPQRQQFEAATANESKLFEANGKVTLFSDNKWKDHGVVSIKIFHNEKSGKTRIVLLQEPAFNIIANHYITPEMTLEALKPNENGFIWSGRNLYKIETKPSEVSEVNSVLTKHRVQFNSLDEAKDFEFAFNKGHSALKGAVVNGVPKSLPVKECKTCKVKIEGNTDKCSSCEAKEKGGEKTSFGGFSFASSPIIKAPVLKLNEETEKPKETPKPSPFAEFSFSTTSTKTPVSDTPSKPGLKLFGSNDDSKQNAGEPLNYFAAVKADPNSFKKDENFRFEGSDSLVFGNLNKAKSQVSNTKQKQTPKSPANNDDEDGEDEFVPTAEFAPVVDLPDLVEVKTGEENDKILFSERAKLLRFDTALKEWKERGVGEMKMLLNEESGKVRLIMRRELVLKVCCNHYLDETMEFKRMTKSEKALTWYAQDYSEGDLKPELLALRFKSPDSMKKFESILQDTQSKMQNGRLGGTKPTEEHEKKKEELKPLSELFKPKAGSWECSTCLIRNNESATKCVSCETPKPGTEGTTSDTPVQNTGLGKGITFPPSTTKYTFGIPQSTPPTSTTVSSSATKFSFGVPQATTTTGFSFGVPQTTTTTSSTGFAFGVSQTTTTTSSTGFSFGVPQTTTTTSSTGFAFGVPTTTVASSGFTFGVPQTTATTASTTFTTSIFGTKVTSSPSPAPSFSFGSLKIGDNFGNTPVSASATTFSMGTGQLGTSSGSSPLVPPKFTFSVPSTTVPSGKSQQASIIPSTEPDKPKTEGSQAGFSFMGALKPEGKEKFEFSISNIKPAVQPSKTSPSPKGKASGDTAESEGSEEEAEEDDGDHIIVKPIVPLPDKVAVHTGEEDEDILYEKRAKLYRFSNKEWKERGIGDVKILKHKTTNKIRLLMRRDTVLKVCLNHYVTPDIQFMAKDEKTWQWSAADFSEEKVCYDMFAIRFKTPEFAQEFMKVLENVKNDPGSQSTIEDKDKDNSSTAMKNFTFAVPNVSKTQGSSAPHLATSDDDVLVVYENKVSPEEREKAESLQLPPNFYAYLRAPDCPGCLGCDKDDTSTEIPQTSAPNSKSTTSTVPPFATSTSFTFTSSTASPFGKSIQQSLSGPTTWRSPNFGSENKSVFSFAAGSTNQQPLFGSTSWKPPNFGSDKPVFSFATKRGPDETTPNLAADEEGDDADDVEDGEEEEEDEEGGEEEEEDDDDEDEDDDGDDDDDEEDEDEENEDDEGEDENEKDSNKEEGESEEDYVGEDE